MRSWIVRTLAVISVWVCWLSILLFCIVVWSLTHAVISFGALTPIVGSDLSLEPATPMSYVFSAGIISVLAAVVLALLGLLLGGLLHKLWPAATWAVVSGSLFVIAGNVYIALAYSMGATWTEEGFLGLFPVDAGAVLGVVLLVTLPTIAFAIALTIRHHKLAAMHSTEDHD